MRPHERHPTPPRVLVARRQNGPRLEVEAMSEWKKVQDTNGAIVGFLKPSNEISVHDGVFYGMTRITENEITIVNNWGGEVSFPQAMFDEFGGYLAGTFIEGIADD